MEVDAKNGKLKRKKNCERMKNDGEDEGGRELKGSGNKKKEHIINVEESRNRKFFSTPFIFPPRSENRLIILPIDFIVMSSAWKGCTTAVQHHQGQ
jgi:hypothetical protein